MVERERIPACRKAETTSRLDVARSKASEDRFLFNWTTKKMDEMERMILQKNHKMIMVFNSFRLFGFLKCVLQIWQSRLCHICLPHIGQFKNILEVSGF